MKRLVTGLLVAAFATTSAFAGTTGTVRYDLITPDGVPGADQAFDVSVQTPDTGIDALDIVMAARDASGIQSSAMSFAFDSAFANAFNFTLVADGPPVGSGRAFASANGGLVGQDILVGRLTIDTTGLPLGTYEIFTDNDAEGIFGPDGISNAQVNGVKTPLFGAGSFNIVPEPATLGLLAIGGLAVLRRRKKA